MEILSSRYKYKYLNKCTRGLFFLAGDSIALIFSVATVYLTLFPFENGARPFPFMHSFIIIGAILIGLSVFRMYLVSWKYASLKDLIRIIMGILLGGGLSLGITEFYMVMGTYEYVFTGLVVMMAILTISGFRIAKRLYVGLFPTRGSKKKHTIIFGAASEGEQILRDILSHHHWDQAVHALFDNRAMAGLRLHGIKVRGGKQQMMAYLQNNPVEQLIIANPRYPKKDLKLIIEKAKNISPNLEIKILPSFHSLTDNPVGIKHIREVQIEDILGREPVEIDYDSIKKSIANKVVMVTGAGGSIGGELIKQCASMQPRKLIALDIDETELFHVENNYKDRDVNVTPCVASVTDENKMDKIIRQYEPDIIFHAAAYKHVPMMEIFPEEAIKVNIGGTMLLASLACKHGVDEFIMISTDKAVNPTNVMGATKRVAEEICMAQNERGSTKFVSVRFGNVLGSRGSVVPLFIDQIKNGGPVTVTHPDVKRFFMTIPEAVLLVMQAGSMGMGGEVFVLDMGDPVKILDMAEDLIELHGLEPEKDIDIEFTGLRPGEKLFEELLNAEEGMLETEHSEISKAICSRKIPSQELDKNIETILDILKTESIEKIRYQLKLLVPTYTFAENGKDGNGVSKEAKDKALVQ